MAKLIKDAIRLKAICMDVKFKNETLLRLDNRGWMRHLNTDDEGT